MRLHMAVVLVENKGGKNLLGLQNWKVPSRLSSYERPQNHSCYRTVSEIQDLVSFLSVTPLSGASTPEGKGKVMCLPAPGKGPVAMETGYIATEWRVHNDVVVWAALLCIRELFVLFGGLFVCF